MDQKTIFLLGGYGNTGRAIARLLLQDTDVRLILAGRRLEPADRLAAELNAAFPGNRVTAAQADAADRVALAKAAVGAQLLVAASSTVAHVRNVALAALAVDADYLDIHYSRRVTPVLKSMLGEIEKNSRCFITQAGFHPGLPAAVIRHVAARFDALERAIAAGVVRQQGGIPQTEAMTEFLEEFKEHEAHVYQDGQWKRVGAFSLSAMRKIYFGRELGVLNCVPLDLEEMRALPPLYPSLKETGHYAAGFNWFADWVAFPVSLLALRVRPQDALRPMARFLGWSLKTFASPPYGTALTVDAAGQKDGRERRSQIFLFHRDGYAFTAIATVACIRQYLDGTIRRPGLFLMGETVEPDRLVADLERLGVAVSRHE